MEIFQSGYGEVYYVSFVGRHQKGAQLAVAETLEDAQAAIREHYKVMVHDAHGQQEFADLVGLDTLISWALGIQCMGATSLREWLDGDGVCEQLHTHLGNATEGTENVLKALKDAGYKRGDFGLDSIEDEIGFVPGVVFDLGGGR